MKQMICALVASAAMAASAATYVTVQDCSRGESGMDCQTITYQVRPASPAAAQNEVVLYPIGEAGFAPAPKVHGGWILQSLQSLNKKAASKGFKSVDQFPIVNGQ